MNKNVALVVSFLAIGIASRFLMLPNFTALGAVALLGGMLLRKPIQALAITLVVLLLSDFLLNKLVYHVDGLFYEGAAYVYLPILGMTLFARLFKTFTLSRYTGLSALYTVVFFLVSNFGVWQTGGMYPKTGAGLMACYVAALPYALNMFLGTLVFGVVIMGAYNLATQQRKLQFQRL